MKRRGVLPMLLAVGVGVAGCGGASKTTSTASETEAPSQAKLAATACLNMEVAALAWTKQIIHVSEVLGKPGEGASLTKSDEESYEVEAAAKKVAAALPAAGEAVTRYLATIGTVRSALSEDDEQHAAGAISEANASVKAVIAACEAGTKT
jgi:hypothetical protein